MDDQIKMTIGEGVSEMEDGSVIQSSTPVKENESKPVLSIKIEDTTIQDSLKAVKAPLSRFRSLD